MVEEKRGIIMRKWYLMSLVSSLIILPINGVTAQETTNDKQYILDNEVVWPSIDEQLQSEKINRLTERTSGELSEVVATELTKIKENSQKFSAYVQLGTQRLSNDEDAIERLNADRLIQLFIAIVYYQQLEMGILKGDETYTVSESDIIEDGVLARLPMHIEYDYPTLLQLMLQSNDTSATDILIHQLGGVERITKEIQALGFLQTELSHTMKEQLLGEVENSNLTSAADVANLLLALHQGVLFKSEINEAALKMFSQHGTVGLAGNLNTDRLYYGKISEGYNEMNVNDALLYETQTGMPFVMVILTENLDTSIIDIVDVLPKWHQLIEGDE